MVKMDYFFRGSLFANMKSLLLEELKINGVIYELTDQRVKHRADM